jgi:hypothetical protein
VSDAVVLSHSIRVNHRCNIVPNTVVPSSQVATTHLWVTSINQVLTVWVQQFTHSQHSQLPPNANHVSRTSTTGSETVLVKLWHALVQAKVHVHSRLTVLAYIMVCGARQSVMEEAHAPSGPTPEGVDP